MTYISDIICTILQLHQLFWADDRHLDFGKGECKIILPAEENLEA